MNYTIEHRTLHFKQPAGTSRGVYHTRDVWYIHLYEGDWHGIGECAPLPDLSCDAYPNEEYEQYLHAACRMTCQLGRIPYEWLRDYPSILFGLEMVEKKRLSPRPPYREGASYTQGGTVREGVSSRNAAPSLHFSSSDKSRGRGESLPAFGPLCRINGLIWMGTYDEMRRQLEAKLEAGYHCIKLKIGAINFEDELALIKQVRRDFSSEVVELRADANGGFGNNYGEAIDKLHRLAEYDLHSIEQPIRQKHWQEMAALCADSPLPIGLDEELIGINTTAKKIALLDTIRPQYVILKPMLHGGFSGCDEWIRLAEERNIGWWATSALESNVGLAAIARWVAQYHPTMPQGLGTGLLYTDNTPPETEIRGDELWFRQILHPLKGGD